MPGGAAGLQNQSGGRKVPGGFDSLPSPPKSQILFQPTSQSSRKDSTFKAPILARTDGTILGSTARMIASR